MRNRRLPNAFGTYFVFGLFIHAMSAERRYSERGKREMDLADASLCWLAVETGVTHIMTVAA